jgi:hypothetical protein
MIKYGHGFREYVGSGVSVREFNECSLMLLASGHQLQLAASAASPHQTAREAARAKGQPWRGLEAVKGAKNDPYRGRTCDLGVISTTL